MGSHYRLRELSWLTATSALNAAYSHPNGAILAYSAMMSAKRCIRVGSEIDRIDNDPKRKASQSLLNPLLRTFNLSLIGERTPYTVPGQMLKKAVVIDIGNTLFKLYNDVSFIESPSMLMLIN